MAYTYKNSRGETYYLNSSEVNNKKGGARRLYFFAKEEKANPEDKIPSGYQVKENKKTGLPLLTKGQKEGA